MGNKNAECKCLDLAGKALLKQKGLSKHIGKLLLGEEVKRNEDERPDFMIVSKNPDSGKETVIGIEHFRVDHASIPLKNNRVGSLSAGYEKKVGDVLDKWKPEKDLSENLPCGATGEIGNLVGDFWNQKLNSTYHGFLGAFKYSINKHIKSIDVYREELNKYGKNKDKKLAFLIEIHTNFGELFFHDKKGTRRNCNIVPMFEDVVKILETIDPKKVDCVILCFGEVVYGDNVNVIALPTKDIRKHLERINVPIYQYAGDDMFLEGFQTPMLDLKIGTETEKRRESIAVNLKASARWLEDDARRELAIEAYKYAKMYEGNGQNYATTLFVEMFRYPYDECAKNFLYLPAKELFILAKLWEQKNPLKVYLRFEELEKIWKTREKHCA